MVMYYLNAAVQGTVVDHAACFRMQIDAVGTVRKRLNAVAEFAFFRVVDFIDKGIAKATHLHSADVTHVEIGVQGGGGFELAVGFQFDFTGFTQLKAGVQGEIVRPQSAGFVICLELIFASNSS